MVKSGNDNEDGSDNKACGIAGQIGEFKSDTSWAYLAVACAGQTAYNMALKDAYNAPEVISLIAQGYRGEAGNIIIVLAKDDFRVKAVTIAIYDALGELIEDGTAIANADGLS